MYAHVYSSLVGAGSSGMWDDVQDEVFIRSEESFHAHYPAFRDNTLHCVFGKSLV